MKKSILPFALCLCVVALVLQSCGTSQDFSKRKYTKGRFKIPAFNKQGEGIANQNDEVSEVSQVMCDTLELIREYESSKAIAVKNELIVSNQFDGLYTKEIEGVERHEYSVSKASDYEIVNKSSIADTVYIYEELTEAEAVELSYNALNLALIGVIVGAIVFPVGMVILGIAFARGRRALYSSNNTESGRKKARAAMWISGIYFGILLLSIIAIGVFIYVWVYL